MDWDEIYFLVSNRIRFRVLICLKKEPKSPSALSKELSFSLTHISTSLKKLEDRGFVEQTEPIVRKNKLFKITPKGKNLLLEIREACTL